jgi:hypothetical protein
VLCAKHLGEIEGASRCRGVRPHEKNDELLWQWCARHSGSPGHSADGSAVGNTSTSVPPQCFERPRIGPLLSVRPECRREAEVRPPRPDSAGAVCNEMLGYGLPTVAHQASAEGVVEPDLM